MKKMNVNSPEYRTLVTSLLGKKVEFEEVPEKVVVYSPISKKKITPLYSKSVSSPLYKTRPSSPTQKKKKNKKSNAEKVSEDFDQLFKGIKDKKVREILAFALEILGRKGPVVLELGEDIVAVGEEGRKIDNKDILNFFRDIKNILIERKALTFKGVQKHPMTGEYLFSWE